MMFITGVSRLWQKNLQTLQRCSIECTIRINERTLMTTLDTVNTNSESLSARAYRILLDRLIMLDIQPGEPSMEKQLAEEMGVGRTPLREALKRLESDHLVVTYPRRGTFASQVDVTDLAHVSEVRQEIGRASCRERVESCVCAEPQRIKNK